MQKLLNKHKKTIIAIAIIIAIAYFYFKKDSTMEMAEANEIKDLSGNTAGTGVLVTPQTANFSLSEFHCKDGSKVPTAYYGNLQRLMNNLQVLRDYIGVSLHINSGYRSPSHNAKIGGAKNSTHKTAKASDLSSPHKTPSQIKAAILHLISTGQMEEGGLGTYPTFIHYDVRGSKSRW